MIVGIVVAVSVVGFLSVFLVFFLIKRRKKRDQDTYEDEGKEGKHDFLILLQYDLLNPHHMMYHFLRFA